MSEEESLDFKGLTRLSVLRGDVLARARRRRHVIVPILRRSTLTVGALARSCDFQTTTIKFFLDGETINMSLGNRAVLARRLGISVDDLPI